jgi:hypothetical protein
MVPVSDPSSNAAMFRPGTPAGQQAFVLTPFRRLARTHAASAMADAMVTAVFASSLFFSLPADAARAPVVRYLLITMLPFAFLSPLIGPMVDRLNGGHRFVLVGTAIVRGLLSYAMISEISEGGPRFFLLALCLLVAQKAYNVARSALVPSVVATDAELVEANSKLAMLSSIAGFAGVAPAALVLKLTGPGWALGMAMITYGVAASMGLRIPASRVATSKADETERHELRGAGIVLAGSAMGLIRMCVGFLTLLIAFDFRGGDRPKWEFALVGGVSVLTQLSGTALAPRLKTHTSEENILTAGLALIVAGGLFGIALGDVAGATIICSCVGFAGGAGKMCFDSILQRDAPDANRGRSFARFETRFQVLWVIGAFVPVAIETGVRAGFFVVFVIAGVALASYVVGRLAFAHRTGTRQTAATAAAVGIEERFNEVSSEVKGRLAAAPRRFVGRLRTQRVAAGGSPDASPDAPAPGPGPAPAPVPDRSPAPGPEPAPGPVAVGPAGAAPAAWHPTGRSAAEPVAYPWEAPTERQAPSDAYLEDLDPEVDNPFPWSTDDPTRPFGEP